MIPSPRTKLTLAMVAALTVPMALSGCSLFAESTNASSSPTPSASASFEVLSSPPAGASDEPSESAAELTQPSKSSEQSPEPSPTRSRSGAATDPNTPQSISTEDASTPEPRPEATGLYSGGFGEGTSVWQVSGAQGGATTAGVAVRKGSKVCFTIGEYEAVGFYGSAQATETDQFLTGTNFGIDSGPAEYRVTGQGALARILLQLQVINTFFHFVLLMVEVHQEILKLQLTTMQG